MEKGLGQVPSQVPSQVLHPSFFIGANVRLEIGLVQQLDILTIGIVIISSDIYLAIECLRFERFVNSDAAEWRSGSVLGP